MTQGAWISLSSRWKLQDVQAAINVVTAVLSFLAVYVCVQQCWVYTTKRIAKGRVVSLSSLVGVGSIGDVLDVVSLLRWKVVLPRYARILIQCLMVIVFSATSIFSGPIARYSTRRETVVQPQNVTGLLPRDALAREDFALLEWHAINQSLESAKMPTNQLLNFLPDTTADWTFDSMEWNNTWSMDCQFVPQTNLTLQSTSNCSSLLASFPGLSLVFPDTKHDQFEVSDRPLFNGAVFGDIYFFASGTNGVRYNNHSKTPESMSMSIAAIHMFGMVQGPSTCGYTAGPVQQASYTKIECKLTRNMSYPNSSYTINPATTSAELKYIVDAYIATYYYPFLRQPLSPQWRKILPTPHELARWYQVYTIHRRLLTIIPVTRTLSVRVSVVQVSTVFIVIASLIALLIVLGLAGQLFFTLRHRALVVSTPHSKLDWMMQSIEPKPAGATTPTELQGRIHGGRKSIVAHVAPCSSDTSRSRRQRAEFESARYGEQEASQWFLVDFYRKGGKHGVAETVVADDDDDDDDDNDVIIASPESSQTHFARHDEQAELWRSRGVADTAYTPLKSQSV